ncbi:hypothetical protein M9H77_30753 [Catharanthus roseus]|uniref:Uncharacterized protein n=1 Tax=Catharanthus roseus TaxID=4058 RepID=A0ACC0A231_CATRO|nr:hypothetical protein M9H77_30753 [Catharanthus roseus]
MHIEKNVCVTLLEMDKKRDFKSRLDLKEMGIRPDLHPVQKENGKVFTPPASFVLNKKEKTIFCKALKGVKVSDGYVANLSRCVQLNPSKILGLKSHGLLHFDAGIIAHFSEKNLAKICD